MGAQVTQERYGHGTLEDQEAIAGAWGGGERKH